MQAERLLVSDLDDTLLGADAALDEFSQWHEQNRSWLTLAYASGRFYDSVAQSIRSTHLPEPSFVIGGVGSELRHFPSSEPLERWQTRLSRGWDPETVRRVVAARGEIEPQPEKFQSPHKVSYFWPDADESQLAGLLREIRDASVDADLIYSSRRDLDVVPAGVNKGTAAQYIAESLGLDGDDVLVAGNSANDAAMFHRGFRGIVVGNAHADLKALEGPDVYVADAAYAAGVLEGLLHWWGDAMDVD